MPSELREPVWCPWREMNGMAPRDTYGTWIQEEDTTGDTVFLVDFLQVPDGWVLRQGFTDKFTLHAEAFNGWSPEFESAINGFRHYPTREELDDELQDLGILPERSPV